MAYFPRILILCLLFVRESLGIQDYCSMNTYNNSDNYMHFTKEATFEEFAVVGKFKGLHCCAKGYRSIEWYKDDKLYPWALHVSHLILFPESANQTIYTQTVTEDDAGNYTCVLKNDTVVHTHTIHLKVFDKVPDEPKITYISQDTSATIGQGIRLFCEAFGGEVDLPDAHSEANWQRVGANRSVYDLPSHMQQLKSNREDGQTFGVYLIIPQVRREYFGEYLCIISKPGNTIQRYVSVNEKVDEVEYINPNPVPVGKLILFLSAVLFSILAVVIVYLQFGLKLRVLLKDSFGPLELRDGKSTDVLIVHAAQDSEIALGVLLPALEEFNYKCLAKELPGNVTTWYGRLKDDAEKCLRLIAVLSPSLLNEQWDSSHIIPALKQLYALTPKTICVTLKELPKNRNESKNSDGETLSSFTKSIGVLLWDRQNSEKFWYSLRLRLPRKRTTEIIKSDEAQDGNESRLREDCQVDM